jgi:hypothetical protein
MRFREDTLYIYYKKAFRVKLYQSFKFYFCIFVLFIGNNLLELI